MFKSWNKSLKERCEPVTAVRSRESRDFHNARWRQPQTNSWAISRQFVANTSAANTSQQWWQHRLSLNQVLIPCRYCLVVGATYFKKLTAPSFQNGSGWYSANKQASIGISDFWYAPHFQHAGRDVISRKMLPSRDRPAPAAFDRPLRACCICSSVRWPPASNSVYSSWSSSTFVLVKTILNVAKVTLQSLFDTQVCTHTTRRKYQTKQRSEVSVCLYRIITIHRYIRLTGQ